MASENSRVKRSYLIPETNGYAASVDETGATAVYVPCEDENIVRSTRALIQRSQKVGRNKQQAHRMGAHSASRAFSSYLHGPAASVSNPNTALGTLAYFERMLRTVLQAPRAHDASAIGVGSTTASVVTATNEMNAGDMMLIRGPDNNDARAMWTRAQQAVSPFDVSPELPAAPTNTASSFAVRNYYPQVAPGTSLSVGDPISWVDDLDGRLYRARGGVLESCVISGEAGMPIMVDGSIGFDSRERTSLATLTALPDAPVDDPEPCVFLESDCSIDGESVDIGAFSIDLGIQLQQLRSGRSRNGRQRPRVIAFRPRISLDPLNDEEFEDRFHAGDVVELMLTMGAGYLSEARLNTWVFYAECQIEEDPQPTDDGGILRIPLVLAPKDVAITGYRSDAWKLACG